MRLRLSVLLWPHEGREDDLRRYEDAVLALLERHRGRLIARETVARASEDDPLEVQVIELADRAAFEAYMSDPERVAREDERTAAIARTHILWSAGS